MGTEALVKPLGNNYVYTRLPLENLAFEDTEALKHRLMNRIISFVLTISAGDTTIFRIAGWDVPGEDMERWHITGKPVRVLRHRSALLDR
jgi:hypothetical protein